MENVYVLRSKLLLVFTQMCLDHRNVSLVVNLREIPSCILSVNNAIKQLLFDALSLDFCFSRKFWNNDDEFHFN